MATFERCYDATDAACALHAMLDGLAFVAWGGASVDITAGTAKEQYTLPPCSAPPMACSAAVPAERQTAVSVVSWWGAEEGAEEAPRRAPSWQWTASRSAARVENIDVAEKTQEDRCRWG